MLKNDVPFATAVAQGIMTEPPHGTPELAPIIEAVARINPDVFGIVEQDMYGCSVDAPGPIAERTFRHIFGSTSAAARPDARPPQETHMSTTGNLRVAVVGAGMMGADHVRRITAKISNADVVAVVEPDESRAQAAAALAPGAITAASFDEALDATEIDGVVIATPASCTSRSS